MLANKGSTTSIASVTKGPLQSVNDNGNLRWQLSPVPKEKRCESNTAERSGKEGKDESKMK